ncbi:MAG: HDOD domain-containing protein [Fibrobacterota bacterium]
MEDLLSRLSILPFAPDIIREFGRDPAPGPLADWAASDPVLFLSLLRAANASSPQHRGCVGTLRGATELLGEAELYKMVAGQSLLAHTDSDDFSRFRRRFYGHSLCTGLAAREIALCAAEHGFLDPEEIYAAGVLHDAGKFIQEIYGARKPSEITRYASNARMLYVEAELRVAGYTHTVLAGRLFAQWGFPELLVRTARDHHAPVDAGGAETAVCAIQLAGGVAHAMGYTLFDGETPPELDDVLLTRIGITLDTLAVIRERTAEQLDKWHY